MSNVDKSAVLAQVEVLSGHKRKTLVELGVPRSTYYRWRQLQPSHGLWLCSGDETNTVESTYF